MAERQLRSQGSLGDVIAIRFVASSLLVALTNICRNVGYWAEDAAEAAVVVVVELVELVGDEACCLLLFNINNATCPCNEYDVMR